LIAPTAAAAASARFSQPDNGVRDPIEKHRVAAWLGCKPNDKEHDEQKRAVADDGSRERTSEPFFLLFELEMDLGRASNSADI
jgi:hypothetical protein